MKTFRKLCVFAGLALAILGASGEAVQARKTADQLYHEALLKKESDGNLQAAIKLFQKLIADFPNAHAVASKAQLQIGLCHEKLGEAAAEKAFRAVIANYPEEREAVAAARERLAALSKPGIAPGNLVLRQVSIPEGRPSPDGTTIAFVDGSKGGALSLFDISTGNKKVLISQPCKNCWLDDPTWSQDGKEIAFSLTNQDETTSLCVMGKNDTGFKTICRFETIVNIAGWSPDKKWLSVLTRAKGVRTISKVLLPEGKCETVMNAPGVVDLYLSPDGNYLSYSRDGNLFVSRGNGEHETVAVRDPARKRLMGWTLDGKYLVFESNRSGNPGIWIQAVTDGKPEGEPTLVKEMSGFIEGLGFTNAGALYFHETTSGSDVYTAQLNLQTGEVLRQAEKIDAPFVRSAGAPFWSLDGHNLYFLYRRERDNFGNFDALRVRSLKTGEDQELSLNCSCSEYMAPPRWSLDGNSIYQIGTYQGQSGLLRINVSNGQCELTYPNPVGQKGVEALAGNTDVVIIGKVDLSSGNKLSERKVTLVRKDLKSGEEKVIFDGEPGLMVAGVQLSPDGKWIGMGISNHKKQPGDRGFYVMRSEGGTPRQLVPTAGKPGNIGAFFSWGPSGTDMLFRHIEYKSGVQQPADLWYVPTFESAEARRMKLEMVGLNGLTFHPDGRTVAFTAGKGAESKTWVLENFLPKR